MFLTCFCFSLINRSYQENLNFVKSYEPKSKEVKHLRILLHGPTGAGKSSFINSVDSILQDRITGRALTDATPGRSFTQKYTTYKISKGLESFYSFIFSDIMGLEPKTDSGINVEDIQLILRGHVRDNYKFIPEQQLTAGDPAYNPSPTVDDGVHVLVSVVPADSVSLMSEDIVKKMREVRLAASEMGIPQLAILTKVDEACPEVKKNMNNVHKNKFLKEQVDKFSLLLGVPLNCIFLVRNYSSEIKLSGDINALILFALRRMITFGEDFLNSL